MKADAIDRAGLERDGYAVVENALSPARIRAVVAECAEIAERLMSEVVRAPTSEQASPRPWTVRLIELTARTGCSFAQHFDISLPPGSVFGPDTPLNTGIAVFALLTDAHLLDVVEQVVGPEIVCNPTQHLRMKLPKRAIPNSADGLSARVPWHQDNGVLLEEADQSHVLTVWIPLTPATIDNGCLTVIPGSHTRPLLAHCPSEAGWAIPESLRADLAPPVALEMDPGSALLMHQRTVHGSLENTTASELRMSLDLRYQPLGEPTGRPLYPSFVARSRANPELVIDHDRWQEQWSKARQRLCGRDTSGSFFRWGNGGSLCA